MLKKAATRIAAEAMKDGFMSSSFKLNASTSTAHQSLSLPDTTIRVPLLPCAFTQPSVFSL